MLHTLTLPIIAQLGLSAPFEPAAVEVMESDTGTEIQALDSQGNVIGTIALYALDTGGAMLSANFNDGYIDASQAPKRAGVHRDGDRAASASCAASIASGGWGTVLVCPASVVVSICACRGVIKKISGFDFSQCEMD